MHRIFAIIVLLLLQASPALAEQRLALIITNADYPKEIGRLIKTHEDGRVIATALKDVGFQDVRHVQDADFQAMRLEMASFVERIEKAGPESVVFFYYSGHGAADRVARGENYLIPTNTKITTAKQLPVLGYGLSDLVKALERVPAKARFAVIDACRDVAFTKGLKNTAKGFAPMRRLDGILLAFATRPGDVAQDAGLYSRALAKHIRQPGLPPERVFKLTQIAVAKESKGNQVPWIEDGLLVEGFRFKPGEQVASVAPITKPAALSPPCDGVKVGLATGSTVCMKPGSGKSFKECESCPEMVVVPAGSFMMGSHKGHPSEKPVRRVTIGAPLAVGKFEVTFSEWDACVAGGGCSHLPEDHDWGRVKRPVINVSWNDTTQQYLPWLSRKTGKSYRLLTEAEWEYVARAGTTGRWSFEGDESTACSFANHADTLAPDYFDWKNKACSDGVGERTAAVGRYKPNLWGLYDVHGNVGEWVQDCYKDNYRGAPTDGSAVSARNCVLRVQRGGSWFDAPRFLRSAARKQWKPDDRLNHMVGFRVVRVLAP